MRYPSSWSVALILCACGPTEPGDTGTASSETSADTSGEASSADTGTASGTSGEETPTTGATPTTGDVLCEDPTVPVGPAVEVRIHNTSGARVFVDLELGCQSVQPFTIATMPGQPALKLDLGSFEFSCGEAQDGDCGRDPGCPFSGQVLQIEAGATLTRSWSGGSFAPALLSESCAEQFCGGCWIEQQAPAGVYTVSVAHSKTIGGCDGECTGCEPNEEGWCAAEGARLEQGNAGKPFKYPDQSSVEVEIF
jgi:hypothetical protein